MSRAGISVICFGGWLLMGGLGLVLVPDFALSLMGIPPPVDPWARLLGMVMLILAYYCIQAARSEMARFFRWSVHARVFGSLFIAALVLMGDGPPVLLMLSAIDIGSAAWTAWAVRSPGATVSRDSAEP